ncbi:MAG: hypothetical protein GX784_07500 [Firmicutes bacterium]|nr:hypothetical protein [Candidatus Fermentithermobacillaceae bacterium]
MIQGRQFTLLLFLVMSVIMLYAGNYVRKGKKTIKIRRLSAVEAIPEAIGRATEAGRPVHFSPGLAAITGLDAPQTFAGISLLRYIAKLTARYDVRLIVTIRQPAVLPLAQETIRQSYLEEGKFDALSQVDVMFLSDQQFAYAAAASGVIMREKAAASFLFGAFWAENLMLAEVGTQVDAYQISGTASIGQVPFFVTTTDYCLIGEELYAAAASLTADEVFLGAILGQDICKGIMVALLVVGVIVTAVGSDLFVRLLSL